MELHRLAVIVVVLSLFKIFDLTVKFLVFLLYMSGLDTMSAILNKEHLARLAPKPGSQLKKDGGSHLPGSRTTTY